MPFWVGDKVEMQMFKSMVVALGLLVATPAMAQDFVPTGRTILPAGQSFWEPEAAPMGSIRVKINLATQMAYVYRANTLIGASSISSGMVGYETPTGVYRIGYKNPMHRSREYHGAAMPFAQFFIAERGIALHAGAIPGHPASHGCVRLPREFARLLFAETQRGDTVEVVDESPELEIAGL